MSNYASLLTRNNSDAVNIDKLTNRVKSLMSRRNFELFTFARYYWDTDYKVRTT